ncbi:MULTISPECIES: hypothetical protein [Acetobacter]|uniref:hypothetical protein n=1 Tax=Acetobacter TaxID=434 RepID=UPI000676D1D9|nr:hypothetical protein [Acetobacter pasteurianus]AKR49484.1 hypothetical protein DB34_11705 [Acetobacter pasteurianus]
MTETRAPFNGKKKELVVIGYVPAGKIWESRHRVAQYIYREKSFPEIADVAVCYADEAEAAIAKCKDRIAELEAKLATESKRSFNAGYLIACCNLCNTHNEESIAADAATKAHIVPYNIPADRMRVAKNTLHCWKGGALSDEDAIGMIVCAVASAPLKGGGNG